MKRLIALLLSGLALAACTNPTAPSVDRETVRAKSMLNGLTKSQQSGCTSLHCN